MIRILVVEDSQTQLLHLQQGLDKIFAASRIPASFRFTDKLETALAFAAEWAPQLVLLDLNLKDSKAEATGERIAEFAHSPCVVVMTSTDTPDLDMICRRAGADTFAHKDRFQDIQELSCIVCNALARKLSPPLYAR